MEMEEELGWYRKKLSVIFYKNKNKNKYISTKKCFLFFSLLKEKLNKPNSKWRRLSNANRIDKDIISQFDVGSEEYNR